jgi:hypothetical protein
MLVWGMLRRDAPLVVKVGRAREVLRDPERKTSLVTTEQVRLSRALGLRHAVRISSSVQEQAQ